MVGAPAVITMAVGAAILYAFPKHVGFATVSYTATVKRTRVGATSRDGSIINTIAFHTLAIANSVGAINSPTPDVLATVISTTITNAVSAAYVCVADVRTVTTAISTNAVL